jgi:small subunit ribosomal protein S4
MGSPRKIRKKYQTPVHPWIRSRIESEREIKKDYALKNKKEIWKQQSLLRKYTRQAKRLISLKTAQSKKEEEQLVNKLYKLGLVEKNASFDEVLSLTLKNILERRLQTIVFKKDLSRSVKQARQFITHGHILIDGKRITSPSYIVLRDEESKIIFNPKSALSNPDHKERFKDEKTDKKEKKKPVKGPIRGRQDREKREQKQGAKFKEKELKHPKEVKKYEIKKDKKEDIKQEVKEEEVKEENGER